MRVKECKRAFINTSDYFVQLNKGWFTHQAIGCEGLRTSAGRGRPTIALYVPSPAPAGREGLQVVAGDWSRPLLVALQTGAVGGFSGVDCFVQEPDGAFVEIRVVESVGRDLTVLDRCPKIVSIRKHQKERCCLPAELLIRGPENVVKPFRVGHFQITPGLCQSRNCFPLLLITGSPQDFLASMAYRFAVGSTTQLSFFVGGFSIYRLWARVLVDNLV